MGERMVLTDTKDLAGLNPDRECEAIARDQVAAERLRLAYEAKAQKLKSEYEAQAADVLTRLAGALKRLGRWIEVNRQLFASPRTRRNVWAEYGLRKSPDSVKIADEAAVLAWAKENGYSECVRTVEQVDRDALLRHLAAGEAVPGAERVSGERAYVRVNKTFVEAELAKV